MCLDLYWLAFSACVLILAYAFLARRAESCNAAELDQAADQVYFLGYLCTILAFLALVLRLRGSPVLENLGSVISTGGIALSTTVAGLAGMAFLRETARHLERSGGVEGIPPWPIEVKLSGQAPESLMELCIAADKARQSAEKLDQEFQRAAAATETFDRTLNEGKRLANDFVQAMGNIHDVLRQHQAAAAENLAATTRIHTGLKELQAASQGAQQEISGLRDQVVRLRTCIGDPCTDVQWEQPADRATGGDRWAA